MLSISEELIVSEDRFYCIHGGCVLFVRGKGLKRPLVVLDQNGVVIFRSTLDPADR